MKISTLSYFLICIVLSSCQISGLTSGYTHLSKTEQKKVIDYTGKIDNISDYSKVYTVTVKQVREYLLTHKKVIVYNYTPFCSSSFCISPTSLIELCKSKGINVLIISNLYDDVFKCISKDFPMLIINTKEYKTKWRWKYTESFYFSLTGYTLKELNYASYHYFLNGTYVKSFNDFKDIGQESLFDR